MNIFILDPNPIVAASYHCDLHIHKMILESAQMASTAARTLYLPSYIYPSIYKPAYINHPCTVWTGESVANLAWLLTMARELESIRRDLGHNPHSSSRVIDLIYHESKTAFGAQFNWRKHTPFATAMYPRIKIRNDLTAVQKYRLYYRTKLIEWGLTDDAAILYKGRSIPPFLPPNNQPI